MEHMNKTFKLVLVRNLRKGDVFKLDNGHIRTVARCSAIGATDKIRKAKVVFRVWCTNGKSYVLDGGRWNPNGWVMALRGPRYCFQKALRR